jgi:aspartate dehydrogenase
MSETPLRKIGIVGCGAIGTEVSRAIDGGGVQARLAGLFDTNQAAASALAGSLKSDTSIFSGVDELVGGCDLVVECAGVPAVASLVELCASRGKDLLVMSVGGLKPEHFESFGKSAASLYIPSGAIAGIDGIIAYAGGEIESLTLTTTKPPAGLTGAPYLKEKGISVEGITEPLTVFEGSPAEAIKAFPKNINVSKTLALACGTPEKMTVRIVADPGMTVNTHEIRLVTPLGKITALFENLPSPSNPKTSALAALSAVAAIKKIVSKVKIGT